MGTGVISIVLHSLPYNGRWLYWASIVIFVLNVVLFCVFFISILRYALYPGLWNAMIRTPAQSVFIGIFPMGFATIVNMVVYVCVPVWGLSAVNLVRPLARMRALLDLGSDNRTRLGRCGGSMSLWHFPPIAIFLGSCKSKSVTFFFGVKP